MATDIAARTLELVGAANGVSLSLTLAQQAGVSHQEMIGVLNSLIAREALVKEESPSVTVWALTPEGQLTAKDGSMEAAVYNALPAEGSVAQATLIQTLGERGKFGVGKAIQQGWVSMDKGQLSRKVASIEDSLRALVLQVKDGEADQTLPKESLTDLTKRKLVQFSTIKPYAVVKGPMFDKGTTKEVAVLTAELIQSGEWKKTNFKKYNFDALGVDPNGGHLHPLLKVREQFRNIFLEMGFSEMPTNNFVESSFWNFDTLFQPQQHPARDAHDTFFISQPADALSLPEEYLKRVETMHSKGGFGSIGYRYDWKRAEAQKNILRTHTTAVSARMLAKLAQDGFRPTKHFSIDRVFRNETLDATHLAEFHQVEGLIADRGLSLGHLIGTLRAFFNRLGMNKLRFKPAYNPYTEPSMEVFAYHEGLKRWIEIGNSGVFRPEMLRPMGLPEDVSVIAWGLSLERPTMIMYGIPNIRDLFGHKVDLDTVQKNPICRLDQF